MSGYRIILRRLRSLLWTALTLITVVAAILVGVGKLLMPYSDRYQPQLEEWLSREFKQPVRIDSFTGEWKAFGPRISLQGVTFTDPAGNRGEIAVQQAALDIKPFNALLPGRPLYSFHVIGADLSLVRLADGRWELSGLGVSGRGADGGGGSSMGVLATVGELRLEDSELNFHDAEKNISAQFTGVRGRLQLDGSEIAAEISASVTSALEGKEDLVLGDIKATLLMTLDEDQRLSASRWHAKTRELMIAELVRQIPEHPLVPRTGWLNAELWGSWTRDSGQQLRGVLDLRDARMASDAKPLQIDHVNARFAWHFRARKVWRLDISEFEFEQEGHEWSSDRLTIERNVPGNLGLWISADSLAVGFPLELTQRIMAVYGTPWPRNAPRLAEGRVTNLDLVLDGRWKLYLARGYMEETAFREWDRWPDVAGLRGEIDLEAGAGEIRLEGQSVRFDWPRNFRRPLTADVPGCTLEILWGAVWRVDARQCALRNETVELYGRLRFAKNGGRPAVDINTVIKRAQLDQMGDYWPRSVLRPAVADWLATALDSGELTGGRVLLRGDMDDWPFESGAGQFTAQAEFRGVKLDYHPRWPPVAQMAGTVQFEGTAMVAQATRGSVAGVQLEQLRADIENFRLPVLELDYSSETNLPDLLGFIQAGPLLADSRLDPAQFEFTGAATVRGSLTVPLKDKSRPIDVSGEMVLPDNGFAERKSGFSLEHVNGTVTYERTGLKGTELVARYAEHDAALSIEAQWAGEPRFRGEMRSRLPIKDVLPTKLASSEPLLQGLSGSTRLSAVLTANRPSREEPSDVWLEVKSDLAGVEFSYPAPLTKAAEENWPTVLRLPLGAERPVWTVSVADRLGMALEMTDGMTGLRRASVQLGGKPAALPQTGKLRVAGHARSLDLGGWVRVLSGRQSGRTGLGGLELEPVTVSCGELLLLGRPFTDVEIAAAFDDDVLTGSFESEMLDGDIRYNRSEDGSHTLTAQMQRVWLQDRETAAAAKQTDPAELPEMHIYIQSFHYLGLAMGETRIEAFPTQNGFRFASVEASSPDFNLFARGDWVKDDAGERSDFDIVMTSESLGSLMRALNVSTVLEGGQTMVHYDAWWPGPPAAFALARLNGTMDFSMIDGTIANADAGAGRMVGLMSVAALPRRLALDFRDVFGSGFGFDEAGGTITLEKGTAHTDDMELKSTAATMEIRGSSDLDNQSFDYVLSIKPGVGQTLPVLGAIAGGPGGAAAGLALQGLLQESLGEAAEARYAITGPWKDPEVIRIPLDQEQESDTKHE